MSDDLDAWLRDFFERVRGDPDSAEQEYDSFPQETIDALESTRGVAEWLAARKVKDLAKADDFDALFRFLDDDRWRLDDVMEWVDRVRAYGEAVDDAALRTRRRFTQTLDDWGDPVRAAMLARPVVKQAYDQEKADQDMYGSWNT
jgi:hypothetical protein